MLQRHFDRGEVMRVFIGMECSGTIRRAFEARGHEAWSCDLKPAEDGSKRHIQGDVFESLKTFGRPDLAILYPVCTYLTSSGYHWCYRDPKDFPNTLCGEARLNAVQQGQADFMRCTEVQADRVAIENPIGIMSKLYRQPDQIIHPNQFGEDASKRTCLWLFNLPPLFPVSIVSPRWVCCGLTLEEGRNTCPLCKGRNRPRPRWGNQTNSGQNKLGPSEQRATDRARTYPGIADAMAAQWGIN